jgi:UDP-2,4-diacetamido-2,4,6-trideoxy-beta-L-altropyranose hydrolase
MHSENKAWGVFRVDGNSTIGTGHVMRCLSLATAAQACGLNTRILSRSLDDRLLPRITAAQVDLYSLPDARGPRGHAYTHSDWLAVTETKDAADCRQKLAELSRQYGPPAFIAVDHYALGAPWHEELKSVAPVLAIDELIDRPLAPDWLVDQTADKTIHNYGDLVPASTHCLIGGQYALLRSEFADTAESINRCRPPVHLPLRVLITMGGVDPGNASATALHALDIAARDLAIETTLVVGSTNSHLAELRQLAASVTVPVNLIVDSHEIAALMARHHLAIGAAGTSALERCAMGLPSLNLVLAENQAGTAAWLAHTGAALDLGWATELRPEKLAEEIMHIAQNQDLYSQMAMAAFAVTDGHGCKRVMDTILMND